MDPYLFSLKRTQVLLNVLWGILAIAASIGALNDINFGCLDLFVNLSTTLHT